MDLSSSDVAGLRSWMNKDVTLSLTYGKTTTGQLATVDASGLQEAFEKIIKHQNALKFEF